jgi:hypothetical protein
MTAGGPVKGVLGMPAEGLRTVLVETIIVGQYANAVLVPISLRPGDPYIYTNLPASRAGGQ